MKLKELDRGGACIPGAPIDPPMSLLFDLFFVSYNLSIHGQKHMSMHAMLFSIQVCIPVGCIPPTCCPYLPACTAGGGGGSAPGVSASGVGVCS